MFGIRFLHPMTDSVAGWVQAGGVYKHIELENSAGDRRRGHRPRTRLGSRRGREHAADGA
jgi:hypothetical protein